MNTIFRNGMGPTDEEIESTKLTWSDEENEFSKIRVYSRDNYLVFRANDHFIIGPTERHYDQPVVSNWKNYKFPTNGSVSLESNMRSFKWPVREPGQFPQFTLEAHGTVADPVRVTPNGNLGGYL